MEKTLRSFYAWGQEYLVLEDSLFLKTATSLAFLSSLLLYIDMDIDDYKVREDKDTVLKTFIKQDIQNSIVNIYHRDDWFKRYCMNFSDEYIPQHPEIYEDYKIDKPGLIKRIDRFYYNN